MVRCLEHVIKTTALDAEKCISNQFAIRGVVEFLSAFMHVHVGVK